jgi:hypothetical protein
MNMITMLMAEPYSARTFCTRPDFATTVYSSDYIIKNGDPPTHARHLATTTTVALRITQRTAVWNSRDTGFA